MNITSRIFGKLPNGRKVVAYTVENHMGASVTLLNYGGIIQSLCMPDREGNVKDIVCGYDNIESYLTASGYQGALIGRYGNRIAKAKFSLDGKEYSLYVTPARKTPCTAARKDLTPRSGTPSPLKTRPAPACASPTFLPMERKGIPENYTWR